MILFVVNYIIPGMLSSFPLEEKVLAATDEGAKQIFKINNEGKICEVYAAYENLNGRYTKYFKCQNK